MPPLTPGMGADNGANATPYVAKIQTTYLRKSRNHSRAQNGTETTPGGSALRGRTPAANRAAHNTYQPA